MSQATLSVHHLTHLLFLSEVHLYELGPLPVQLPPEAVGPVAKELIAAGFLSDSSTVSELGRTLLSAITTFDDAYVGVLLLHNQRQPVSFPLDDQWAPMLQDSFLDTPRVYVLAARTGAVVTLAVRSAEAVHIGQHQVTAGDAAADVAALLLRICDPEQRWNPATMASVDVPLGVLATAPPRRPIPIDPSKPTPAESRALIQWRTAANAFLSGMPNSVDNRARTTLGEIIGLDHVASMSVMYQRGATRHSPEHALSIDYFHEGGVTVSYPRLVSRTHWWRAIRPATVEHVAAALRIQTELPARDRNIISDATAHSPSHNDIIDRLRTGR